MYNNRLNNRIINNPADEPKVVCAEYSNVYEQNRYALHSAISIIITAAALWAMG